RRHEADRGEQTLDAQLHALGADRSRLASELDAAVARSRTLEITNREVAQRLDAALDTTPSVLPAHERPGHPCPPSAAPTNAPQSRVAGENGEGAGLPGWAQDLDARTRALRARFGEIGDTRLTVMAALALADELSEVKEKLQRLEPELATLQGASVVSADRA